MRECKKLYANYRDEAYQKQRQKYECWYTKEINELIGKDHIEIKNRNENLTRILKRNITGEIKSVLDFGGDKGQFIPEILKSAEKFVYEISGVTPVDGIKSLTTIKGCKKQNYDLILCSHVLEHAAKPEETIKEIKSLLQKGQYLYVELPFDSPFFKKPFSNLHFLFNKHFKFSNLIKHFIYLKKTPNTHIMNEHINFFTPKSINKLLEKEGFKILSSTNKTLNLGWKQG